MKSIKLLSFLFIAISAMMFTSCVDDDDDNRSLTPAEIQTAFNSTKGTHSGKLVYQLRNSKGAIIQKNDTLSASWTISSDSTMTFNNLPASAFAYACSDSVLMKAMLEQSPKNVNCYIGYVNLSPVQWLVNPTTVSYTNVSYNGGSHKVSFVFAVNNAYSFGQVSGSKQAIQILIGGVYLDNVTATNYMDVNSLKPMIFLEN